MTALLLFVTMLTADPRLESLWNKGLEYDAFHQKVDARRPMWDRNTKSAEQLPPELVARAKSIEGNWRLLVIAVDGCSDSASSVPYIAALAKAAGFELRIVRPSDADWLQENHRTPDRREATPTVVLVNAAYQDVGAWVERPVELQTWMTANRKKLDSDELHEYAASWYDKDKGRSAVREIVEMIEKAAARVE